MSSKADDEDYITLIIGKDEERFRHEKAFLIYTSTYFETMLTVRMKENNSNEVDWRKYDPKEWKIVSPFLTLNVTHPTITKSNVDILLRWCDFLQLKGPLKEECDAAYSTMVGSPFGKMGSSHYDEAFRVLGQACRYNLAKTKYACIDLLKHKLGERIVLHTIRDMKVTGELFGNDDNGLEEKSLVEVFLKASSRDDKLRSGRKATSFDDLLEISNALPPTPKTTLRSETMAIKN